MFTIPFLFVWYWVQFHGKALSTRSQRRNPAFLLNIRQCLQDGGIKYFLGWSMYGSVGMK